MNRTGSSGRQDQDFFPPLIGYDGIFQGVPFLFAGVGHPPQFRVFGPGARPFGGIDDHSPDFGKDLEEFIHGPDLPFGKVGAFTQDGFQDRLVGMHPIADAVSGYAKEEGGNGHGGVNAQIQQNKEQHACTALQGMLAAAAHRSFAARFGDQLAGM